MRVGRSRRLTKGLKIIDTFRPVNQRTTVLGTNVAFCLWLVGSFVCATEQHNPLSKNPSAHDSSQLKAIEPSMDMSKTPLPGRIEQIERNSASLPISLTSPANKSQSAPQKKLPVKLQKLSAAEVAHSAPAKKYTISASAKDTILKSSINDRYPDYLFKRWGAVLNVRSRVIDKPNPADMHIKTNENGVAIFSIEKGPAGIVIDPTTIFFSFRTLDSQTALAGRISPGEAQMNRDLFGARASEIGSPKINLGASKTRSALGAEWDDTVVSNSVHRITPDTAEQDVVSKRYKDGKQYGFRESVVRFHFINENKCLIKVAVSDYSPDGASYKRTILEGEAAPADSIAFASNAGRAVDVPLAAIESMSGQ